MKKIKYALLLFGLFSVFTASSQYWEPIATMPGRVQATCVDGNFFYVAYHTDTNIAEVARWDGISWTKFPKVVLHGNDSISQLAVYKDELYLSGAFDSVGGFGGSNFNTRYIIKFDGNKWDSVGYGKDIYTNPFFIQRITDMLVKNGKLYVCGGNLVVYNGANWRMIPKVDSQNGNPSIYDIDEYKDTLVVSGVSYYKPFISKLKNDSLIGIGMFTMNSFFSCTKVFFHDSNIFYIYASYIYPKDFKFYLVKGYYPNNTGFNYLGKIENANKSVCEFRNQLFIGLNLLQNDSLVPLNTIPIYKTLVNIDTFKGMLIATGGDYTYNNSVPNIISVDPFRNSGFIEGQVYLDTNKNCYLDSNEISFNKGYIEVLPGPYYLKIENDGTFRYSFPDTTYMVNYINTGGDFKYFQLTSCNNYTREITINNGIADSIIEYGFYEIEGIADLTIDIFSGLGWRTRSGFREYYRLKCKNIGSVPINNVSAQITYDSNLVLKSHEIPDSLSTNTLFYHISKLDPGETKTFGFTFQVPISIAMGDSIHFYAQILTSQNDTDLTNNYDTLIQTIVGAVDPNDKTCFPAITINKNLKKIEYLIRFQNVGSDTAYKVVVVDTIDTEFLPLTKIVIDEVSHPYDLDIKDNILTWTFYNILLPDSTTDEPGSHGYIKYTASVKPGLKVGDTIINRAYIYFDYQKVLPTNIAMSVIIKPDVSIKELENTEDEITLFPNPARDELLIKTKEKINLVSVQVYDMMGNKVMETQTLKTQRIRLPDLESGHYILILNSDQRSFVKKFIVLTK